MSYLCDVLFIFARIFIFTNDIASCKQTYLFFVHFFRISRIILHDNVDEESE